MHASRNTRLPGRVTASLGLVGLALLAPLALAAPPGPAKATRHERQIIGSIINVFPQGDRSVLVINRGSNHDAAVGDLVKLQSGPTCKLSEVYPYRSKCVVDVVDGALGNIRPLTILVEAPDPARPPVVAQVLEIDPEESGFSVRFDKGFFHGVRVGDEVSLRNALCKVWEVLDTEARCASEAGELPPAVGDPGSVMGSGLAGRRLGVDVVLRARAPELPDAARPTPGTEPAAEPLEIVRHRGEGLVPSRHCLGIVPGRALYLLRGSKAADPKRPGEEGRELVRVDFTTGLETKVLDLPPGRPREARSRIEEVRVREQLVACHNTSGEFRDPDGPGPWDKVRGSLGTLGRGKTIFLWQPGLGCTDQGRCPPLAKPGSALWAIRNDDAKPVEVAQVPPTRASDGADDPGYDMLGPFYFTPSSPRFAAWTGLRWVVFDAP
jgi:hypothetical protein